MSFTVTESLTMIDLAIAAYIMSAQNAAVLPEGWEYVGLIETDQDLMEWAATHHPRLNSYADHGQFGYVAKKDNVALVAVRGTENFAEWIEDFEFIPVLCDLGRGMGHVESGFFSIFKAIRESILSLIQKAACTSVQVTAHSLGAPVVTICAADLVMQGVLIQPSIVFASPRPGLRDFRDFFNAHIREFTRVVNLGDVVTDLPHYLAGFRHVGNGTLINSGWGINAELRHLLPAYKIGEMRREAA